MSKLLPISDLLNLLFAHIRQNDETEYKNSHVAKETGLNPVMLHNYRTGRTTTINTETVASIAEFFGVPPAYFFSQTEQEAIAMIAVRTESPTAIDAISLPDETVPYINEIAGIILQWEEGDRAAVSKLTVQMLQAILNAPIPPVLKDHLKNS